jgi:2-succinyl-5-enolpyruvyl-6-hydroxy-3-cyclohexene-1-carboxylate synthase
MSTKNKLQNINSVWANLIVEELQRCGVETFCVAPGSRSAPLAVAVAALANRNPKINAIVHVDERGLGFHALGLTSATLKPVVIITTSGTAVANLFPSIIEASKKKLPLIILSADRPPELRSTGANQTIDQVKIFGDTVRFFFDLPCPSAEIAPETVLTTIDYVVSRAKGELPGPVHINCMFREPLAPHQDQKDFSIYLTPLKFWQNNSAPYTHYPKPQSVLSDDGIAASLRCLLAIKNGIIAVGKISGVQEEEAVLKLAEKLNWPIFADVTSGLRLGHQEKRIIHHFDHILGIKEFDMPVDGILHLGGRLTSSHWLKFVKTLAPRHYLMVLKHPLRNDPHHMVSLRLQSSVANFCTALAPELPQRKPSEFLKRLQKVEQLCSRDCQEQLSKQQTSLTESALAYSLTTLLPENSGLFIGNSMPIRELNLFASNEGQQVKITANRGASGIDGNIATAAGFAKGIGGPCTAIIGDLAFLYDLNSLAFLQQINKTFILIVINNNGGAIFSFLPIAQMKGDFEKFFTTPHQMTFEAAAKLFNLSHSPAKSLSEFKETYRAALAKKGTTIIEVFTDKADTLQIHSQIQSSIEDSLRKSKFL